MQGWDSDEFDTPLPMRLFSSVASQSRGLPVTINQRGCGLDSTVRKRHRSLANGIHS